MDSKVLILSMVLTGCPMLIASSILLIRIVNKFRKPVDGERRQHPKLRRTLNVLMGVSFVATVLAILMILIYMYTNMMMGIR